MHRFATFILFLEMTVEFSKFSFELDYARFPNLSSSLIMERLLASSHQGSLPAVTMLSPAMYESLERFQLPRATVLFFPDMLWTTVGHRNVRRGKKVQLLLLLFTCHTMGKEKPYNLSPPTFCSCFCCRVVNK